GARSVVPTAARYVNAAEPIRSNLLRLEHKLQTVVDGGDIKPPRYCKADDTERDPRRRVPPVYVLRRRLRLPCSFKGVGGQLFVRINARESAGVDRNPRSPAVFPWKTSRRTRRGPDGTQPEHSPSADSFIEPYARNWQAVLQLRLNGGEIMT